MGAPTENLVRSSFATRATVEPSSEDARPKLVGYFSTFGDWYEVNSAYEGHFLERVVHGAYKRSLVANRDRIKVLYDHGYDPQLGNKPLGPWEAEEDDIGARYSVDLIDTDYNRGFIIPAAEAGVLGSSFRFSVTSNGDRWSTPTRSTDHNPDRLRERTITEVDVWEFGPVTFPANPAVGSVGLRSTTDEWIDRLLHDSRFVARLCERMGGARVEELISSLPAIGSGDETPIQPFEVPGSVRASANPEVVAAIAARNSRRSILHELQGQAGRP